LATILIIDEDVALLASLETLLEQEGYQVFSAPHLVLAEQLLTTHQPALVLLEVEMAQGEGWKLLEQLAKQVLVLVLTTNGKEESVIHGLELGAVDYLTKPYRSIELLTRLRLRLRGCGCGYGAAHLIQLRSHRRQSLRLVKPSLFMPKKRKSQLLRFSFPQKR